jgi:hypothetical protein
MVDRVEEQLEAYNAHDLERFVACYAPDVLVDDGAGNVLARGHEGLRARYGPRFRDFPNLHAEIPHRVRLTDYVVDEELITGWKSEPVRVVAVYRLVAGEIVHVSLLF